MNKPSGPTSHDVVARIRSVSGEKRVGHAGTLDPMASGVLLVCLGDATRIVEYLMQWRKSYRATAVFGVATDTEDATGTVIVEADASDVTDGILCQALDGFRGRISQVPPMVSAVRHKGRKLYELARAGRTVERTPRIVEVYSLDLVEFRPGAAAEAVLDVECSKGTFVRTLCADIGRELGCGGHMKSLVRTAVGPFRIEDSLALSEIEERACAGLPPDALHSIDEVLCDVPAVEVRTGDIQRVANGAAVEPIKPVDELETGRTVRIQACGGQLLALGTVRVLPHGGITVKPIKVFAHPAGT